MRRIEKEFNKRLPAYEEELNKLGYLEDETEMISGYMEHRNENAR